MQCSTTWAFSDMTLYLILTILLCLYVMCNKELNYELYYIDVASSRKSEE